MGKIEIARVVIDTNVLVSALLFGGVPGRLAGLWKTSRISALVSGDILAEYLRVLAYPRFHLTENEIHYLLHREILPWFEAVRAPRGKRYVAADPSDDKFIWCATAGKAEAVISGDEHLLSMKRCPVPVLSVSEFLRCYE